MVQHGTAVHTPDAVQYGTAYNIMNYNTVPASSAQHSTMPTSAGNSIAHTPTMYNTGHKMNNNNTVCATKALPLINIKENKILMPSHSTNLKIHLPDQKAVIESLKSGQWPPPHLANIKNHTIALVNNLNQPVILTEKKATLIKITPAPVTDTRLTSHTQYRLNPIKPAEKLTDAKTIGLIKYGQIDPKIKHLLHTAHNKQDSL